MLLLAGFLISPASAHASTAGSPDSGYLIDLDVHELDLERGIFHVRQSVPVAGPGEIALLFPEFLPGLHGARGAVNRLGGLTVRAGGQRLAWRRSQASDYAFHIVVPAGVSRLELEFHYLAPPTAGYGHVSHAPTMVQLQWENLVLYPAGTPVAQIPVRVRLQLPTGWRYATALDTKEERESRLLFETTSLRRLVDSPLFAGRHMRSIPLGNAGGAPVNLHLMAEDPALLEISDEQLEAHRGIVREGYRLFGSRPFRKYEFLVGLTSELGEYGLEHQESSQNVVPPNYLSEWNAPNVLVWRGLLAHEFIHAWNGKCRQPAGNWIPDFNTPRSEEHLWIYEGLTTYLTGVLSARSGMFSYQHALELTATFAALNGSPPGARWRPLGDTVHDPLGGAGAPAWRSWQRFFDFYNGGSLIWMEADLRIRKLSRGERSLDDFLRDFFARASGTSGPRLYELDEIIASLNRVQESDWEEFFEDRLWSTDSRDPVWLEASGYRLIWSTTPTEFFSAYEVRSGVFDFGYSIGLRLSRSSPGLVVSVEWDSPAFAAGITPGATILTVDERDYSPEALGDAIARRAPMRLGVRTRERNSVVNVVYAGGPRYPQLQRIEGSRDVMRDIYTSSGD